MAVRTDYTDSRTIQRFYSAQQLDWSLC